MPISVGLSGCSASVRSSQASWWSSSAPCGPFALGRKNHLFAGSDEGGRYWAIHASLIETCKMNDVDPQAWLADVLDKIANRHPMSKIDELLPWAYINNGAKRQAA